MIDETAVISPRAEVGTRCRVGAYAVVEDGAVVENDCMVHPHAVVRSGTILREGVTLHPGVVVGGEPQIIGWNPEIRSGVEIGAGTVLREGVTVNRASKEGGMTNIGPGCYLMSCSHVGHDSVLGEKAVLANCVLLGGHVEVGSRVFMGGGAGVHQFCRIGDQAMVSGNASISEDVPPFVIAAERNDVSGLNLVGLRRSGVARDVLVELKHLYWKMYGKPGNLRAIAEALEAAKVAKSDHGRIFLRFFSGGTRKIARPHRPAVSLPSTEV